MARREEAVRAHLPKGSAASRRITRPQEPTKDEPCPGAAAQLAAVHRTLRRGPALQLQPGGAAPASRTGLPDRLKAGVEALSGISLDGVKVHYNSSKPAQLNAHAYAQGNDIHLAPGQERHLPHEAWHVVQQAQGRVRPTMQMKGGVSVNDDAGLEHEANVMAGRIAGGEPSRAGLIAASPPPGGTIQGWFRLGPNRFDYEKQAEAVRTRLTRSSNSFHRNHCDAILKKIEDWSGSEAETETEKAEFSVKSYDKLIQRAMNAVIREQHAARSKLPKAESKEEEEEAEAFDYETDVASEAGDSEGEEAMLDTLGGLRRTASLGAEEMAEFRDRESATSFTSSDVGATYSIAPTSNFMLGGGGDSTLLHSYAEIIADLKEMLGDDRTVARALLDALGGGPLEASPLGQLIDKFRSLVLGPEFRRAAINPVAAKAALFRVATSGGDLFNELRAGALFVASEKEPQLGKGQGGSARSQFHRREINQTNPDFSKTAKRELRNIRSMARRAGVSPKDVDAFVREQMKSIVGVVRRKFRSQGSGSASASSQSAAAIGQIPDSPAEIEATMEEMPDSSAASAALIKDVPDPSVPQVETRRSGNCLYEGVNIVLGNEPAMNRELRRLSASWLTDHPEVASRAGLNADRVMDMVTRPGQWMGNEGDLAPYLLACAIRRDIQIRTPERIYLVEADVRDSADPIPLYLVGGHYTVHPPPGVAFADDLQRIKGPGSAPRREGGSPPAKLAMGSEMKE